MRVRAIAPVVVAVAPRVVAMACVGAVGMSVRGAVMVTRPRTVVSAVGRVAVGALARAVAMTARVGARRLMARRRPGAVLVGRATRLVIRRAARSVGRAAARQIRVAARQVVAHLCARQVAARVHVRDVSARVDARCHRYVLADPAH
ncbi:hypothetical protein ABZ733_38310, partial [Streptomyces longwoodensis]|uniref:hypothetical protein n=1 Tax=Streptomyces longwoodensis TaxID=68231 RepID=UPI0033F67906